jgi:hypothetical protein
MNIIKLPTPPKFYRTINYRGWIFGFESLSAEQRRTPACYLVAKRPGGHKYYIETPAPYHTIVVRNGELCHRMADHNNFFSAYE